MAGKVNGWKHFQSEAPDIAEAGRRLFSADGTGIAFLGTVRKDGGPRIHPVMPVLAGDSLYVFVVNLGWKYRDLRRDGRYALHSSPKPQGGEEFYVTGSVRESSDSAERAMVRTACDGRLGGLDFEALFELGVDRALHTRWANWGTAQTWPEYSKWAAD